MRSVGFLALLAFSAVPLRGQATGNRERGTGSAAVPASQFPVSSSRSVTPGSELQIFLMTMGPGDKLWERFGHNAIRIVDASRGTDSVYNWGTFDFQQPNFVQRFMTGNTEYWLQNDGFAETLAAYRYWNRSMWVQELDFTPAERAAVRDFIVWNAQPEHRYYRYDYYLDNCSTRVRDIIDRVVRGQLRSALVVRLTTTTYRFHTQRALEPQPIAALGTNIALGELADHPLSAWEESFLPEQLRDHVRSVQVRDADGATHPLVKSEQQLFAANRPPLPAAPPNDLMRNLLIGVAIAGVLALLARSARSGRRSARIAFTTLATVWVALSGILGAALTVAWIATRHVFIGTNENLLQFDPLSLVLAVALPLAVARGRAVGTARVLTRLIAALAVVGLAMKLLPWFNQVNGSVIALTLPVHLALAGAVAALAVQRELAPGRSRAASGPAPSRSPA